MNRATADLGIQAEAEQAAVNRASALAVRDHFSGDVDTDRPRPAPGMTEFDEPRHNTITPWLLWSIDHPREANCAESWLDEVADGGAPIEDRASDEVPAGTVETTDGPLWRRAISTSVSVVLALVLILVMFISYGRLDNRWYHLVTVQGGSMEPTYSVGDVLVLTRPPENIQVGMVLTMQVDGAIVTHRVVEVSDDGLFVTQGDANDHPDDFTGLDVEVVGHVRGALPWIGKFLGGGGSTNAWFTDRAIASAMASGETTIAPNTFTSAVSNQQEIADSSETSPPEGEPSAEESTGDNTGTEKTVTDETIIEETVADKTVADETVIVDTVVDEMIAAQSEPDGTVATGPAQHD